MSSIPPIIESTHYPLDFSSELLVSSISIFILSCIGFSYHSIQRPENPISLLRIALALSMSTIEPRLPKHKLGMEGNLYKWTNIVSRWKRRYFYIQRGVLRYAKDQGQKQLGFIPLQFSSLYIHSRNPCKILINTGVSTVHLRGTTVDEVKMWFEALVSAQNETESTPSSYCEQSISVRGDLNTK